MKLNNKGFAISTVLYSLLIMVFLIVTLMMGIMASNRKSNRNLVETIEDELNRYNESATTFAYKDGTTGEAEAQIYTVPSGQSGWYKIELWGASGGNATSETGEVRAGGKGAYTSGLIYLTENQKLYFYIGGTTTNSSGGANGGGTGAGKGMGGGGSTDVRIKSGAWDNDDSLRTRLMVAAGGGGAEGFKEGAPGGDAGAVIGSPGQSNIAGSNYTNAGFGSQKGPILVNWINLYEKADKCNSGYISGDANNATKIKLACGKLGLGGAATNNEGGGGGSGYFGGGAGSSDNSTVAGSGAGGSSFIAGYAGVKYSHQWTGYDESVYFTENSKIFIDGQMVEGVNEGNGKARIELVSTASKDAKPTVKNSKLSNVRYIKSCTAGTTEDQTTVSWAEIAAIQNGNNLALNKEISSVSGANVSSTSSGKKKVTDGDVDTLYSGTKNSTDIACTTIDLGSVQNLDEIAIYHNPTETNKKSYKESLQVSANNRDWITLISSNGESLPENSSGIRYTAWDLDYQAPLPNGIYQVQSALSQVSRGLSAVNNNTGQKEDENSDTLYSERHVKLALFGAQSLSQDWSVTSLGGDVYRLVETASNRALQIKDSLGTAGTAVNTSSGYGEGQGYNWTQWHITSLGDGTYIIKADVGGNCLSTVINNYNVDSDINIDTCNNSLQQRWIFKSTGF
ncbi:MAG: glycine-rich protein [Bacilli bacterium]|nr:glycine-rich protein [Bacilli bacterium]